MQQHKKTPTNKQNNNNNKKRDKLNLSQTLPYPFRLVYAPYLGINCIKPEMLIKEAERSSSRQNVGTVHVVILHT